MTDMYESADKLRNKGLSVDDFSERLIKQMNIHDRHEAENWFTVSRLVGDYAREIGRLEALAAVIAVFKDNSGLIDNFTAKTPEEFLLSLKREDLL